MKKSVLYSLATCLMVVLLASCWGEPTYPHELVEADSAMYRGDYEVMDSLLRVYAPTDAHQRRGVRMYYRLLHTGLAQKQGKPMEDLFLMDTLLFYYQDHGPQQKYARTLFYMGCTYDYLRDIPTALNYFMQAATAAEQSGDTYLLSWVYRQQGDLYLLQDMYEECAVAYRKYHHYAMMSHNARQLAFSWEMMGKVYTLINDIDSTIYSYQQAIMLGSAQKDSAAITQYPRSELCDIYIQLEEFDKARQLITDSPFYDYNRGYLYLGEHRIDSAIYYFERAVDSSENILATAGLYQMLALLEQQRGNTDEALKYFNQLVQVNDSVKLVDKSEELGRVNAQYNYQMIKDERDRVVKQSKVNNAMFISGVVVVFILLIILYFMWQYNQNRHMVILAQERLLRIDEENKNKQSQQQIEDNKLRMAELEKQLAVAKTNNDAMSAERLRLEAELLNAENERIKLNRQHQQLMVQELENSDLYLRIKSEAGTERFHLSEREWMELKHLVDGAYDDFTHRLLSLAELSEIELQVCCLLKLGIPSGTIAVMLFKSKNAISMIKKRIYEKVMKKPGSAKLFDEFLSSF